MSDMIKGVGSKESPLVSDLLDHDSGSVPECLKAEGNYCPESRRVPFSLYYDSNYAALEMEHVWKKCWQYACREEDVPEVGDRYPYEVGSLSFIVLRSAENEFRAFHNSCLHRGTKLCSSISSGDQVRCPFHGWSWNLDGSVREIPGQWDFPHVDESYRLPEVKLARWGGCLFINPDSDAGPLEEALGVLPEHFKNFDLANRFTLAVTQKKIRANWKHTWAAFLEAYHVAETHFDAVDFNGDSNTKYDCYDDGNTVISRLITPAAVPSPGLGDKVTAREAAIAAAQSFANALGPAAQASLPDFDQIPDYGRRHVAAWRRETMQNMLGADASNRCDSEMLDAIQYAMFPNFGPWLGEGLPLMYQFLPSGDNPDESLFTVRLLAPVPDGMPRPPSAPVTQLGFDEFFESLPEWGRIAHVFDQDMSNLPVIQAGMRAAAPERSYMMLGRYQEQRIRLMHEFIDQKIAEGQAS
ncbi:aromatic ring-hydroxylating oxygenase subunit alpha [Marinobacter salarius]|uniref:aromatic ring-hydroxylating oxygenase subunit alpha n=1 Tax=Marinobacter salarius TaxID=1420917 RepID=UPI0032EBB117